MPHPLPPEPHLKLLQMYYLLKGLVPFVELAGVQYHKTMDALHSLLSVYASSNASNLFLRHMNLH